MTLTTPLTIGCFFFEPDTLALQELNLPIDKWKDMRDVVIYDVANISPYWKGDVLRGAISSDGTDYLTDCSMKYLEKLIQDCR